MDPQIDLSINWLNWGIIIIIVLPVVILALNEIIYRLKNGNNPLRNTLRVIRNSVIPMIAIQILLVRILGYEQDGFVVRMVETLLYIFVINAVLTILNDVFLGGKDLISGQDRIPKLLRDLIKGFLVLLGTTIILSLIWEFPLADLITALGVTSLVLGMALQDTLGNLFSGISLLYAKPFEVGDWVQIGTETGKVIEVNWRSVRLLTRDEEMLIIPNLVLGKEVFKNFSRPRKIYAEQVELGFSYDDPPNKVHEVLKETALSTPGILKDPSSEVMTVSYDDFQITYVVKFFIPDVKELIDTRNQFMTRIWYVARRHGLNIPFPIRNIYNHSVPRSDPGRTLIEQTNDFLREIPVFSKLENEETLRLAELTKVKDYGEGEPIISQNTQSGPLHIIMEGKVEVCKKDKTEIDKVINELSEGDIFGEMALIMGNQNSVTVRALTDTRILQISPNEIFKIIEKNPSVARDLDMIIEARRMRREQFDQNGYLN